MASTPRSARVRSRLVAAVVAAAGFAAVAPAAAGSHVANAARPAQADLLAGVRWLTGTYPSPCGEGDAAMVAGSVVVGAERAVLEDVKPLRPADGLALAIQSCRPADDGTVRVRTASVIRVGANGALTTVTEWDLPGGAEIVGADLPTSFTIETPEGAMPAGSCCAPYVRRQTVTIASSGLTADEGEQLAAFERTVSPSATLGASADLVKASIEPAGVCYQWDDAFYPQDIGDEPPPITEPPAELQTMRLALIYLTGEWIAPASYPTPELGSVATAFQQSRGLLADGVVGAQTQAAIRAELGCPGASSSFRQVIPPELGPRRFANVAELLAATSSYSRTLVSANHSLDALLFEAGWDGGRSMFLGCVRRDSPKAGVTCSWSGTTPLQLVGLLDNADEPGIGAFSILYARISTVGEDTQAASLGAPFAGVAQR